MEVSWFSRKGEKRSFNSDAVAVGYKREFIIAVIVDAAEQQKVSRCNEGKRLATYWADNVLQQLVTYESFGEEEVVTLLQKAQLELRKYFLHDIASYGILVFDKDQQDYSWWYVGDCQLGGLKPDGQVSWFNEPHRVNAKHLSKSVVRTYYGDQEPTTLRKCLNAKRFVRPTFSTGCVTPEDALIIATDGYWCEHLEEGVPMCALTDDASFLKLVKAERKLLMDSDVSNLLVFYGAEMVS